MDDQRVYADLNKREEVNGEFRVILTARGTHQDLQKYDITLKEGLFLDFRMDDEDDEGSADPLYFDGVVHYEENSHRWVAVVDCRNICSASELNQSKISADVHREPAPVGWR